MLSTARDIIYLWVARMIMMGLEFRGDVPFRDVIIHPTVLATDGRRMSKSLGTGVDPLDLIAEYGADATRFGLAYMSSVQDVRFSAERIEMGRNFANKIWNASRLVLQGAHPQAEPRVELATVADRWIFSRLATVTQEIARLCTRATSSTTWPGCSIASCGTRCATGTWKWPRPASTATTKPSACR